MTFVIFNIFPPTLHTLLITFPLKDTNHRKDSNRDLLGAETLARHSMIQERVISCSPFSMKTVLSMVTWKQARVRPN